jgi:hypothetical protein
LDSQNNAQWYVNGLLVKKGVFQLVSNLVSMFRIGAGFDVPDGNRYFFHGKIDDIRIYNRALSASEVQQLYQGQGTCSKEVVKFTS